MSSENHAKCAGGLWSTIKFAEKTAANVIRVTVRLINTIIDIIIQYTSLKEQEESIGGWNAKKCDKNLDSGQLLIKSNSSYFFLIRISPGRFRQT